MDLGALRDKRAAVILSVVALGVAAPLVARLTFTAEEVNGERARFAQCLLQEADQDLNKLGLVLDTLKIQSVSDDADALVDSGGGEPGAGGGARGAQPGGARGGEAGGGVRGGERRRRWTCSG